MLPHICRAPAPPSTVCRRRAHRTQRPQVRPHDPSHLFCRLDRCGHCVPGARDRRRHQPGPANCACRLDRDGHNRLVGHRPAGHRCAVHWPGHVLGHPLGPVPALLGADLARANHSVHDRSGAAYAHCQRHGKVGANCGRSRSPRTWGRPLPPRCRLGSFARCRGAQCVQTVRRDSVRVAKAARAAQRSAAEYPARHIIGLTHASYWRRCATTLEVQRGCVRSGLLHVPFRRDVRRDDTRHGRLRSHQTCPHRAGLHSAA